MRLFCILILIVFFNGISYQAPCQKMVLDSVVIPFGAENYKGILPYSLSYIRDQRENPCNLLWTTEKVKYMYIPVDLYYLSPKPVSEHIAELFTQVQTDSTPKFKLQIRQFEMEQENKLFKSSWKIISEFEVERLTASDTNRNYKGFLRIETLSPIKSKKLSKEAMTLALRQWQDHFIMDMNRVAFSNQTSVSGDFPNFRPGTTPPRKNLLLSTDCILSYDNWMWQGELMFSTPEIDRFFMRRALIVRYRNAKEFESIGFGRNAGNYIYRLSNNFLFHVESSLLMSINKWKNFTETQRKLQEIFTFEYALSQKLIYNRFDRRGLLLGIGLMENVYYIIEHPVVFRPGILFSIGVKI